MPLTVGESTSFKAIVKAANEAITPPGHMALKNILHSKNLEISEKLKAMKDQRKALFFDHRSFEFL
jgi:hypothetical protein